jgi:hypothetical protein
MLGRFSALIDMAGEAQDVAAMDVDALEHAQIHLSRLPGTPSSPAYSPIVTLMLQLHRPSYASL